MRKHLEEVGELCDVAARGCERARCGCGNGVEDEQDEANRWREQRAGILPTDRRCGRAGGEPPDRADAVVPRLWNETIEAHRHAVRDAILSTTAALVAEHGLLSVTMSQIAEETGIGRATLYKYFSDVEAILLAWHERQITGHLQHLAQVRDAAAATGERLEAVLEAYAFIAHESQAHHSTELAEFLHRDGQVALARKRVRNMIRELVNEAAQNGDVRDDVAPDELTSYCLHALAAASSLASKAAVRRLVTVTLAGLRAPR